MSTHMQIPGTPRVISPSPDPTDGQDGKEYFGPVTRSATRAASKSPQKKSASAIDEADESSDSSLEKRARTRSRSPVLEGRRRRMSGLTTKTTQNGSASKPSKKTATKDTSDPQLQDGKPQSNGHLSPISASMSSYWRDFSRSPSPLGLIPVHRHFRSFIHRHEVPRKVLHVSIGFFTLYLYTKGVQTSTITPCLLSALIPIASIDILRHKSPSFNRLYIRVLGALMRESEVDGYNGVIWYLLGAWIVLGWFPKDIGVMGVLLLSWCDTAASTFGRLYGRYTIRIRHGKSLAGTLAALAVGVVTAAAFWGWLVPRIGTFPENPPNPFMFTGTLSLPEPVRELLGWGPERGVIGGSLALGIMSLWSGIVASASEVVDLWGWDDNLTIPILSGLGLWGFLKIFG
ncbi:phosphatidate cytidylyltransferase [Xylona heveae TC161]|uniref:Phosphatidate cytidylyltransferase n=1 Tax=Xylona heveae (strain CBS 132557 / TC161) TaxID=1328760 RepID=A0A165IR87_XYLHT|nr:phosphatidate cytidylyltransferase [Xylona heveae TC161]KZF25269.1 phosphatidate cytidylyltransferase [Xylona heveae TC161]